MCMSPEVRLLRTRHATAFDLLGSHLLDPARSPYTDYFTTYVECRATLSTVLGTNQFLWCIDATREFPYYEAFKPIEWLIRVSPERILGFVREVPWYRFLRGVALDIDQIYSPNQPGEASSILVPYPLRRDELVRRTHFEWVTLTKANIISDEAF